MTILRTTSIIFESINLSGSRPRILVLNAWQSNDIFVIMRKFMKEKGFWEGVQAAVPTALGYVSIGLACGIIGSPYVTTISPLDIIDRVYFLNVRSQTLQTIGNFRSHRASCQATNLLEISELSDFHTVKPNFPTKTS